MKNWMIEKAIKKYHSIKKKRLDDRAGFKKVPQREAYLMEDILTVEEKKHYCERKAYSQLKYFPNLDNPKSFNEKIIWLALNYKNPIIAKCTDKYEMKRHIASIFGEDKYYVKALGIYTNINDIPFDELPSKFVIKSTAGWGSKQVIIVKNKETANLDKIKSRVAEWLYPWNTYYYNNMCITDEKIKPRILIEEYLEDLDGLKDYKLYCFNGEPKMALTVINRGNDKEQRRVFTDIDEWKVLPFTRNKIKSEENVEKPQELETMINIAKQLSKEVPMLRVDFFINKGKIYVGEMTFSPGMFLRIRPKEWDFKLGEWLNIKDI